MIVDGHAHAFLASSERYPRVVDELSPPRREAPAEDFLARMSSAGVERAVLVPLGPEDEYVAECLRRYPERFAAVGVLDPAEDPVEAARGLRARVERTGIRGLRMGRLGGPAAARGSRLAALPVLEALAERDMVLWFYGPPEQLDLLAEAVGRLPELRVALNHLGFCPGSMEVDAAGRPRIQTEIPPATLPVVLDLARGPNVVVMLSGTYAFSREPYPYRDLQPVVRAVYEAYGAGRMFWASDYPWIRDDPGYAEMLSLVDVHLPDLSAMEREQITGGTVRRLLGWDV
jgi:L-fuconolactonase